MPPRVLPPLQQIRAQVQRLEPRATPSDEMLTVAELSQWLRVAKTTIYRAVEEGRLPVLRLGAKGRVWRFSKQDILHVTEGRD